MPAVSVVMPAYNAASTIASAIESIILQTLTDWELILIDDGSTDHTAAIISEVADSRIRLYRTANRGIARALNFGIKLSRGRFIARMDADDISHSERLHQQANFLKNHPHVGVVSSLVAYAGDRTTSEGYAYHVEEINKLMTHEQMHARRFQDAPVAHPSVMYRKQLVGLYGGYHEGGLPEDFELWLRWMSCNVSFAKLPDYLLSWTDHATRLSRTSTHYDEDRFHQVKARYLAAYLKKLPAIPRIWVWGTGKLVNRQVAFLKQAGIDIEKYIDVIPHSEAHFIHYKDIPTAVNTGILILSYVKDRKGKIDIHDFLISRGYCEGSDFFFMN